MNKDKSVDVRREKIQSTIKRLQEQIVTINTKIGNLILELAILDEEK